MNKQPTTPAGPARLPATASRQRGVTLVELMVALLLGLVLTAGFIQVFLSNRVSYAFNEGMSRIQESGRFAVDTLNYRIRMAGHVGCLSEIPLYNNLATPTALPFNFGEAIIGYEANGTGAGATLTAGASNPANSNSAGDWTPNLPAELAARGVIPGSDVIVVRNFSGSAHALRSPFSDADTVYVDADAGAYVVGDIAVASDCQKASIFQVTGVTTSGTDIDLAHASAGAVPGNATATWNTDQAYSAGAELVRGETWVYFVGAPQGGGAPALFQGRLRVNTATSSAELVYEEIADSVETMQMLYGVDTNGDDRVDEYRTAANVAAAEWDNVVTVRIGLVMRSPDEYGAETDDANYLVNETTFNPVNDRRVRQVFTTTIALRNRLP